MVRQLALPLPTQALRLFYESRRPFDGATQLVALRNMNYFCIIAQQRSGTLLLVDLLNSHPEVIALREAFISERRVSNSYAEGDIERYFEYRKKFKWPRPFVSVAYMNRLTRYLGECDGGGNLSMSAAGFKVMYNQLARLPEILLLLITRRYRVIHLVRENHLDVLLSDIRMNQHGIGHSKETYSPGAVKVDAKNLLAELKRKERQLSYAKTILSMLPVRVFTLTYEDLSKVGHHSQRDMLQFLGVKDTAFKLNSSFKKQSVGSYRDKIENYDEVVTALSGTSYERLLFNGSL